MLVFSKLSANRYGLGLSNGLLFINKAQESAKLYPVKVGGLKKLPYATLVNSREIFTFELLMVHYSAF